ncbi:hypothetical protein GPECTOR_29g7 [Gonium pectorale]|uniref:N-acetyltransferase domain-containing protein n=1 Tax=Gonium pectorale TaxID=33097 RepID=A0A150GEP2_GONPE|nr:hypothetical protein GPECTOR_29g7 [Gonium pectorale]|eukprot:KXZ48294.1 hypothetical protein GPECTOR_29g7 [Gonium pectorale]
MTDAETSLSEHAWTIRHAAPADLDTIVGFNVAMAKETEALDLPIDTARAGVQMVLEARVSAAAYFVLELPAADPPASTPVSAAGGAPSSGGAGQQVPQRVVAAQLMITKEWSDWRARDIWWVQSVYVRPEYRRRGLFKALYRHVRAEAEAAGAAGVRLYTDTGNQRSHSAYEGLGMTSHYKVYEDMFTHY